MIKNDYKFYILYILFSGVRGDSCNRVSYIRRRICAFKGSSVDIICTYNGYNHVTSKFWFSPERSRQWQNPSQAEDLSKDSQYSGRVQVFETETGRSTLRITDLRETDSAQYHFKFITRAFEWRSSLPGTTLTVTDPDLQVQVIWSSVGPKLVCHSSCLPPGRSFVWYKNETKNPEEISHVYSGYIGPADSYSCAIEGYDRYRTFPVYVPKVPLVLMSNTGDIMKETSVSLTCSSDANPAAKYSWYKNHKLLSAGPQLVFISIQYSDSGDYYCAAKNELGKTVSEHILINVKYGPRLTNISVSPSVEIVEGILVTLTCSSDANPAANYTWYKDNRTLLQGPEGIYHFAPISSTDKGMYHCKSENPYRQINSTSLFLDVHCKWK
ncbi:neurotrimin-like [Channa argus]|uniref:neurotrimin-like n=1 Tax=Channa argus TaxID=215402 RepID=UPI003522BE14